ncbi:MAG: chloride channel protein [Caldilineaceae bacterium]|nr:chloride channel protein [Caldilineaceae bacterium]
MSISHPTEQSQFKRMRSKAAAILDRTTLPEEAIIVGTALIVGIGTGLGAVIFIRLLERIQALTYLAQMSMGMAVGTVVMMTLAGVVVGAIIQQWASEAKGHGVPEVMEAVAIRGGRIRPRVAVAKILASSLTIGTGGSAGREGPIVQVGSALGSTLGQLFHFSEERVRTLVACGAAAGIAATFNAPIAGTIFALEVILGSFTIRYFGGVVISSVAASIVSRALLSSRPAFSVPAYPLSNLGEIPLYITLGVLAALVAVLFIRVLYAAEGWFDDWKISLPVKTGLGMFLTALIGIFYPGHMVLGAGLDVLGEAIAGNVDLTMGLLLALLVGKMLTTTLTLGSGNSGGVFAPSLFMGAILGGMVGQIGHALWPGVVINPGAYAIVGMAAVFSGAARAPITAVLIVFEMSNDYQLILPLMLATVLSTLLAELLFPESIYTLKLKLKGISLERGRDQDILESVTVKEVMTQRVETVPVEMTLVELSDRFSQTHTHGFPVVNDTNELAGIVTISDLDLAIHDEKPRSTTVLSIGTPRSRLLVATPDETVGEALARMGARGLGRLPVLESQNSNHLLGVIKRHDIIRAYTIALSRRAELQHRAKRMQIRNIDGTRFADLTIEPTDFAAGKPLHKIAMRMPGECILVSIRRNGRILIPHGDTLFQPGDTVTAFVQSDNIDAIRAVFQRGETEQPQTAGASSV